MATHSQATSIPVEGQDLSGTFLSPETRIPGVLFIHGWGGSQRFDLMRARSIAGLGCICLTFDLRGHAATEAQRSRVSRGDNLRDVVAAYDQLLDHPSIDSSEIAVVGSSYGGYLAAILSTMRPVKWLALHVPALYRDEEWDLPKGSLSRESLAAYRLTRVGPDENRALAACEAFTGDVLIVESEHDTFIPHSTIMNYRSAFLRAHSMTHRIVDGADHGLTDKAAQQAYTSILLNWTTEMIVGARVGGEPVEH
ncbi:alpha/beta hydrolase family protein [Bordetella petrii]|uniref:alpha/beta hydrolase family protein n=1 Tax=Bordetella petrii TaxID=94624 RepID=UPI001A96BEFF|nr:alpha/beta fold hydrolase [Bordetella petrii]MBO1113782.1 alpha/beta fold hydrolase [Bordetella petrii]